MKKITTSSGAVYYLEGTKITGGSKKLKDGEILVEPVVGHCMLLATPERLHLNPHFSTAGVMSSQVVSIENVYPFWWGVKQMFIMFRDAWRAR